MDIHNIFSETMNHTVTILFFITFNLLQRRHGAYFIIIRFRTDINL